MSVIAGTLALGAKPVLAGEYTVSAGMDAGCVNRSWAHSGTSGMLSYDYCPQLYSHNSGMVTAMNMRSNGGYLPLFSTAVTEFDAPAGTYISHLKARYSGYARAASGWGAGIQQQSGGAWQTIVSNAGGSNDWFGWASPTGDWAISATSVRAFAVCGASSCPTSDPYGVLPSWPGNYAYINLETASVTLHEDANPTLAVNSDGIATGGWVSGIRSVNFSAEDYTGIEQTQLIQDPGTDHQVLADVWTNSACDYSRPLPCTNYERGYFGIDTTALANGHHTYQLQAENAAGNWTLGPVTDFYVNNTPPGGPQGISVDGGEGWHTTNSFTIRWRNPDDRSGIAMAYYELCDSNAQSCIERQLPAQGVQELTRLAVPGRGVYKLRVWLGDTAGLASATKSDYVTLKFDDGVPGMARLARDDRWVNAARAAAYQQEIDPPQDVPASGIAGYAVTTDGTDPGASVSAPAQADGRAILVLPDLPEGQTTVRARAVSNAGVGSATVASTVISVDKTPPSVALGGQPDPNSWTRGPVALSLEARDALSGMAPSPDATVSHGGFIDYSVDGGPDTAVPGGSTVVAVGADGAHAVDYQAFDLAGNPSAKAAVYFKIDRTPPVAGFEAQDPADPTKVAVLASDATSGLADGGVIRMRAVGSSSWASLPTNHDGNHYYAHIRTDALTPGPYEFEATVPDQAGNTVTTAQMATGPSGDSTGGGPERIDIDQCHVGGRAVPCAADGSPSGTNGAAGGPAAGVVAGGTDGRSYTVVNNLDRWLMGPDGKPYDYGATVDTRVRAGIATSTSSLRSGACPARPGRSPRPVRRRCKRARAVPPVLATRAQLPFGRGATIAGDVELANGRPLSGVQLLVLQRYESAGSGYAFVTTLVADASGRFNYTAPPGASRTISFLFRGDRTFRHADAGVLLQVPAASTIHTNRRSVRNGSAVTFSGRLRGGPFPEPGKLVALDAHYRGRWRTFAITRADARGRWAFRYQFQATHGIVAYQFRAQLRQEAAYPYLLGFSPIVVVRVAG